MPLVFVHGVANRQSEQHRIATKQRDALFKQLVLTSGAEVFDPDWGSNAVSFNPDLLWLPRFTEAQPFAMGGNAAQAGGHSGIGALAARNPAAAVDLAFEAALTAAANSGVQTGDAERGMSSEQLETFLAAVKYLEKAPDRDAFDATGSDDDFVKALASELKPFQPPQQKEAMSFVGDALGWIGKGLREIISPVENVAATVTLLAIRRPLSSQAALFLGDIFVYLRWRESDSANGTVKRIFTPIIDDLAQAAKLRTESDPLIVVGHSLGGVILYDMLTDTAALKKIEAQAGRPLHIDAWITVGSQPSLFADMGLYGRRPGSGDDRLPRPTAVGAWFNVYDYTDIFSFRCDKIFRDVVDLEFDNLTGLLDAHTAYFQRPSFYARLRARLKEIGVGK